MTKSKTSLLIRTDSKTSVDVHIDVVFSILSKMSLIQGRPAGKILYKTRPNIKISRRTSSLKFIYQAIRNLPPLIELSSLSSSLSRSSRDSSKPRPVPLLPRRSQSSAIK